MASERLWSLRSWCPWWRSSRKRGALPVQSDKALGQFERLNDSSGIPLHFHLRTRDGRADRIRSMHVCAVRSFFTRLDTASTLPPARRISSRSPKGSWSRRRRRSARMLHSRCTSSATRTNQGGVEANSGLSLPCIERFRAGPREEPPRGGRCIGRLGFR